MNADEARNLTDGYTPPGDAQVSGENMKWLEKQIARNAAVGRTRITVPTHLFPGHVAWAVEVLRGQGYRVSRGWLFGDLIIRW